MDTKKITALLLAVQRGSLTAAATELGYTQSGLTQMMNSLEEELGLNLLIRRKNGVQLSAAGQALLDDMMVLSRAARELESHAEHLRESGSNTLRLGAYASVATRWLPAVLAEFRRIYPKTEVAITVGGVESIYDDIRDDRLDCAIVSYQELLMKGLVWQSLKDDELVAVLPAGHGGDRFPVEGFDGMEFLMPSSGFERDIAPVFHRDGRSVQPRISYTNLDDPAIVSMVQHGLGVSILSELVMQNMDSNVSCLHLSPAAFRRLGIIYSRRRSSDKQILRFTGCAGQVIGDMYRQAPAQQ